MKVIVDGVELSVKENVTIIFDFECLQTHLNVTHEGLVVDKIENNYITDSSWFGLDDILYGRLILEQNDLL